MTERKRERGETAACRRKRCDPLVWGFRQVAMADGPQEAPALHNPAGVAEGKEAVQGAAEVGAAPPLPEAVGRRRWQKRHLLPEAQEPPGLKTPPAAGGSGAACASMPALHNPVGAASTAVATSPAVHVLSPRGPAPRPLEPPPGLALSGFVAMQGPNPPAPQVLDDPMGAVGPAVASIEAVFMRQEAASADASDQPASVSTEGAVAAAASAEPAGQLVQQPPPPPTEQLAQQPPPSPAGQLAQQRPPPPAEQLAQQPLPQPPAGPPAASGTQASEDPVAAAGATQALVPQTAPVEAGAGLQAPPFGLSVADVPCHSRGNYVSLHKQARAALNNLYATGLQEAVAPEFAWREYVCAHPASRDLVGPGIQSFVAEPIAGTRDANRRGHPRIDFVVQRVDGWVSRLHPGHRPQEDAAVCWFPPGAFAQGGQASGVGAGMYVASAAQPAPAGGPPVLLTVEEAACVPPADRMGKAAAYEHMTWLRGRLGRNEEHGLIDVTHCADFAWQTWLANVRDRDAFIGPGICKVFVTPPTNPEVQLRAQRCDGGGWKWPPS